MTLFGASFFQKQDGAVGHALTVVGEGLTIRQTASANSFG